MLEQATEQVEKAESISDLETMGQDFEAKFDELEKKYPDFKPTAEEEQRVEEAQQKFQAAIEKKAQQFVDDMLGDGDDPGEPEE